MSTPHDPVRLLTRANQRLEEENARLKHDLALSRETDFEAAFRLRWKLTGKEARILSVLYRRSGGIVAKETLLSALYGGMDEPEPKIIDVFVCKIRAKVGYDAIETAWGLGHRMTAAGLAACAEVLKQPLPEIVAAPPPPRPARQHDSGVVLRMLRLMQAGPLDSRQMAQKMGWTGHRSHSGISYLRRRGLAAPVDQRAFDDTGRRRKIYGLTADGRAYLRTYEGVQA